MVVSAGHEGATGSDDEAVYAAPALVPQKEICGADIPGHNFTAPSGRCEQARIVAEHEMTHPRLPR